MDDDSSVRVLLKSILVRDRHDVNESPMVGLRCLHCQETSLI